MLYQKEIVVARRIQLHRCSKPLIFNHYYYFLPTKGHELSKIIHITDKTHKNSTACAINGVQILCVRGGGNQIWSGIPKVQGTFGHTQGVVSPPPR